MIEIHWFLATLILAYVGSVPTMIGWFGPKCENGDDWTNLFICSSLAPFTLPIMVVYELAVWWKNRPCKCKCCKEEK